MSLREFMTQFGEHVAGHMTQMVEQGVDPGIVGPMMAFPIPNVIALVLEAHADGIDPIEAAHAVLDLGAQRATDYLKSVADEVEIEVPDDISELENLM